MPDRSLAEALPGDQSGRLVLDYAHPLPLRPFTAAKVVAGIKRLGWLVVVACGLFVVTYWAVRPTESYRLEVRFRQSEGTIALAMFAADVAILLMWQRWASRQGLDKARATVLLVCGSVTALGVAAQVSNLVTDPGYPQPVVRADNFRPTAVMGAAVAAYGCAIVALWLAGARRRRRQQVIP